MNKFYAVIMAGGQGTRLWPLSRKNNPKQLHPLVEDVSMIRATYLRLLPKFSPEEIIISTTPDFAEAIKAHLPEIPKINYIVEPFLMGNAAACGLVTKILNTREPNSAAIFLPADAHIEDKKEFIRVIDYAEQSVLKYPDHIIALGIEPKEPNTGLGYIQINEKLETAGELELLSVKRFVEKPDRKTAEEYIQTKEYFWNGGIFIWKTANMLGLIEQNLPLLHKGLENIGKALGTDDENKITTEEYGKVEKTSIDYGIMEKTNKLLLIPSDFGWSDVGSWETLLAVLQKLRKTNVVSSGPHVSLDDKNVLVMAKDKLIATVGLNDIAIIDTPDAILVCDTKDSGKVKELLEKLEEKYL